MQRGRLARTRFYVVISTETKPAAKMAALPGAPD